MRPRPASRLRALPAVLAAALLAPADAGAQGLLRFEYDVRRADPAADPALSGALTCEAGSLYGGVRAELLPQPDLALDLHLGLHPSIRRTSLDFNLAYHHDAAGDAGTLGFGLTRPFGGRTSLGAGVSIDPGTDVARTEVRAAFDLSDAVRLDAALVRSAGRRAADHEARYLLDLGAARALSATSAATLRFRDDSDGAACAELSYRLAF